MSRKNESLKFPRHGSSLSETILDVGYSILDLMEAKQRRSNRGYTIAMIAIFALGFLAGRMYEGYTFKGHTSTEQPAPTYKSKVIPEQAPSAPRYNPTPQEQEEPDDTNKLESPMAPTSSQLRQITEESKGHNHGREQLASRTSMSNETPIVWNTEWRYAAREGYTQPAATPNLSPAVKETKRLHISGAAWERSEPVASRPMRINAKKGTYPLR